MILRSKSTTTVSSELSGVALLPSTGEWVYSTTPTEFTSQTGETKYMNTLRDTNATEEANFDLYTTPLPFSDVASDVPQYEDTNLASNAFYRQIKRIRWANKSLRLRLEDFDGGATSTSMTYFLNARCFWIDGSLYDPEGYFTVNLFQYEPATSGITGFRLQAADTLPVGADTTATLDAAEVGDYVYVEFLGNEGVVYPFKIASLGSAFDGGTDRQWFGDWEFEYVGVAFNVDAEDVLENGVYDDVLWEEGMAGEDARLEDTNMEISLSNLKSVLPRVKWVSFINSWFGDDLRLGECTIKPKGEQFQFYELGGQGGTIELDKDIGPWAVGADGVTERTLYDLDESTVYMNRIADGGSDVKLTYNWSTTAGTETTIDATIFFYSDDAGTVLISQHDYPQTLVTEGSPTPMSGTFTDAPVAIPPSTQSIAVEVTRSTSGSFNDVDADRQLDVLVQAIAPELKVDSGSTAPYPYTVNGLSRNEMEVPSIVWEAPTEYNPVYVQWIAGRNGAAVTTTYDSTVDPDPSIGQPYINPGSFADQDAGIVLVDYAGGTNQEGYAAWNHADTSTGGPGGNIPTGTYRFRTFIWSPVARFFTPFVRKGGVGSDILVAPEDKWVPAQSWTEIVMDFGTDETFSYVEMVLDEDDTDASWFYTTNTTIFNLETPRVSYGGTPADRSVVEGIVDLKSRGYNVMFYPFILMDITAQQQLPDPDGAGAQGSYPWRGRIRPMDSDQGTSAVTADMDAFFGECTVSDFTPDYTGKTVDYSGPDEWGLRRFTLHYAYLCAVAGGVDAFCIATEMVGMTEARDGDRSFPAINKLKQLAADVKGILGEDCEITYACDWSEFMPRNYDTAGGFNSIFHLDPLWSDPNIDFVGIDNYIPISDWRGSELAIDDALWDSIYNLGYLKSQIEGGERYDYQYLDQFDRDNQVRTPLTEWRYKDKAHKDWWENFHYDIVDGVQNSTSTAYVPQLKRIVYTEYGCAAVDKGTNQPNKFLDPKSAESSLPYYSDGSIDVRMQKVYYQAMGEYWNPEAGHNPESILTDDNCIDYTMMFAWTWDARPWPAFPRLLDRWSDGENYSTGHWLQGRQWIEKK